MTYPLRLFYILLLGAFLFTPLAYYISEAKARAFYDQEDEEDEEKERAINQYDKKYKAKIETCVESCDNIPALLPNYYYFSRFIRSPEDGPDDITMRLLSPLSVTGCLDISAMSVKVISNGPLLRLELIEAEVKIDSSIRYAHYECDISNNFAQLDIKLNRADLLKNNTNRIIMRGTTSGLQFEIKIKELNERKITVETKAPDLLDYDLPITEAPRILTHWFYPNDTLMLHVPALPRNASEEMRKDVRKALTQLAYAKGLTPLKDSFKDFKHLEVYSEVDYFRDPSKRFIKALNFGHDEIIGKIEVFEKFYGPNGPYKRPRELDVFARLPGTYN